MKYATPEAFKQALEARTRTQARTDAIGVTRLRQVLVFDRFLARVFAVLGDRGLARRAPNGSRSLVSEADA